jgi:tetratricopeptide (TPR) repeat protein
MRSATGGPFAAGIRRARAALAVALILVYLPAAAQTAGKLFVRPQADAYFPLDTYTDSLTGESAKLYSSIGFGVGSALDFAATPWLVPFARAMYMNIPYAGGNSLGAAEGDLGLGFVMRPTDRLSLRLDAMGGLAELFSASSSGLSLAAGARLGIEYRLVPAFTLSASGGYQTLLGTAEPIVSAISAGLYLSYDLSALGGEKARVAIEDPKLDAVFPSLYAYYDDNAFGTVKVVNREDAAVTDVKVSFNAGHYMDQPKVCAEYASLGAGQSVLVPVKALFTDSVLQITQGTDAKGEIIVEYSYLGSERVKKAPIDFRMHHRNAITWSDDRRAASFVSTTNPAALWFSRYASGVVRDRMRGDINKPLQYAIGMFEAERLYGLNYVVVPANDYSVKHGLKDYIDSVQFPHQTLSNRGGDCSDLAILFATLMQSVGVEAAFITVPGHIFAAFDTGLGEEAARSTFYDPNLLLFKDGKAWIPVEITMVKDGFIKAWRVAAKEWADNQRAGTAAFYTLPDCWKVYPPAAFPGVNPRFVLPAEAETAVAFDGALDRFVAREIEPRIESLRTEMAEGNQERGSNDLGVLYANYGMLKESWKRLSESARASYQPAWTNIANLAFLRKNYKLALSYYSWSFGLNPTDDYALLGRARCSYELEDFKSSDADYAVLQTRNPALAAKYGYLGSIFGGEGRAWSLADRALSTAWTTTRVKDSSASNVVLVPPNAGAERPKKLSSPPPVIPVDLPTDPDLIKAVGEEEQRIVVLELPGQTQTAPALAAAPAAASAPSAKAAPAAKSVATAKPSVAATAPAAPAAPATPSSPTRSSLPTAPSIVAPSAEAPNVAAPAPSVKPAAPSPEIAAPKSAPAAPSVAAPVAEAPSTTVAVVVPGAKPAPMTPEVVVLKKANAAQNLASFAPSSVAYVPNIEFESPVESPAPEVAVAAPSVAASAEAKAVAPSAKPAAPVAAAAVQSPATETASAAVVVPKTVATTAIPASAVPSPAPETTVAALPSAASSAPSKEAEASVAPQAPAVPASIDVSTNAQPPARRLFAEGLKDAKPLVGEWKLEGGKAMQLDPETFHAKLAIPLRQEMRSFAYSFNAKSDARGRGWVGVGLHVFTPKSYTLKGYGSGDSLCLWLTRDPVHFTTDITRLQLYRSVDDWDMKLLCEAPVSESIYDDNRFEIVVDPATGKVTASLNGTERLSADSVLGLHEGVYVVLRALDTAEFHDLKTEIAE